MMVASIFLFSFVDFDTILITRQLIVAVSVWNGICFWTLPSYGVLSVYFAHTVVVLSELTQHT